MLSKNLRFVQNGVQKVAKWSHIIKLYENDLEETELKACPKLTIEHVYPDKICKMKVSCCTQVFSQGVAAVLKRHASLCRGLPSDHPQYIDVDAIETADVLNGRRTDRCN